MSGSVDFVSLFHFSWKDQFVSTKQGFFSSVDSFPYYKVMKSIIRLELTKGSKSMPSNSRIFKRFQENDCKKYFEMYFKLI